MCEAEAQNTPSAKLAAQAADALLKVDLVRTKDLDGLRSALAIGTATAGQWLLWVDLAAEDDDSND